MQRLLALTLALTLATLAFGESEGNDRRLGEILSRHRHQLQHQLKAERALHPQSKHDLPVPVMIAREGYPVEIHQVITEDCYILEMHRIPYGKNSPEVPGVRRPAVYLQHGLLCSSADWVMGIPEKSLGYILADAGYDVWLGNYRGNTYSRGHCTLDPDKDNEFWEFSWDENGKFDIPAMIDKILEETGHEKIHYAGHSMGTTGFMVMANERPEHAEKIIMANLLAPVAYMHHMQSPLHYLSVFLDEIEWIAEHLGLGEFLPSSWLLDTLADLVCDNSWLDGICSNIMFLICGFDPAQLNETLLETIMHHTPAGGSTFQFIQYGQEYRDQTFHAYDFGKHNEEEYGPGVTEPPRYYPANVNVPVSLYWSQNDWLADPVDIFQLLTELPSIFDNYEVPFDQWNHLDYLWGIDAPTLVYNQLQTNMALAEASLGAQKEK